jgi:hypothetical protein
MGLLRYIVTRRNDWSFTFLAGDMNLKLALI